MRYLFLLILYMLPNIIHADDILKEVCTKEQNIKDSRTYTPVDFNEYNTVFLISFDATKSGFFGHAFITIYENNYFPTIPIFPRNNFFINQSIERQYYINKLVHVNQTQSPSPSQSFGKYPKDKIKKFFYLDKSAIIQPEYNNLVSDYSFKIRLDFKTYMKIKNIINAKVGESDNEMYILSEQDCLSFIIELASEIPFLKVPKRSLKNSLPTIYLKDLINSNL